MAATNAGTLKQKRVGMLKQAIVRCQDSIIKQEAKIGKLKNQIADLETPPPPQPRLPG